MGIIFQKYQNAHGTIIQDYWNTSVENAAPRPSNPIAALNNLLETTTLYRMARSVARQRAVVGGFPAKTSQSWLPSRVHSVRKGLLESTGFRATACLETIRAVNGLLHCGDSPRRGRLFSRCSFREGGEAVAGVRGVFIVDRCRSWCSWNDGTVHPVRGSMFSLLLVSKRGREAAGAERLRPLLDPTVAAAGELMLATTAGAAASAEIVAGGAFCGAAKGATNAAGWRASLWYVEPVVREVLDAK